ncbi:hypothetical protein FACS1894179_05860 [Bacteroidia bacterium]|nr:hypothetical protein FACS1894179_05860 [Bacteroidia bacterium]
MIAKNIKGKSFKGCVNYVMNETAELLEAEGVFADSIKSIIRSFAMQRSGRKEIKQAVGHIPMSFAPEDKTRMTNDFMLQLAKEYMREMGIQNTQYIIVRHHNTDNEHLHIVYNRIDNNLKLISVNNDYKRNVKTCKKLKDKYNLSYGKGKDRVKREKLKDPDKVKYYIYDAIRAILPTCKNPADLRFELQKFGIELDYKLKRTTKDIEGVSFRYNDIAFKGSQIDRKFSFGNLQKLFKENISILQKQAKKALEQQPMQKEKESPKIQQQTETKPKIPTIGGIELTAGQWQTLKDGGFIYLENMIDKETKVQFSSYVFLNEDKDTAFFNSENPDNFIKYGKYEMRIWDKILVENGHITKAKVKWYGGGFAYPYLWKENKGDTEYKESWSNPRVPKTQKEEKKPEKLTIIQKKNHWRKR